MKKLLQTTYKLIIWLLVVMFYILVYLTFNPLNAKFILENIFEINNFFQKTLNVYTGLMICLFLQITYSTIILTGILDNYAQREKMIKIFAIIGLIISFMIYCYAGVFPFMTTTME